jgi:hypothetical protein
MIIKSNIDNYLMNHYNKYFGKTYWILKYNNGYQDIGSIIVDTNELYNLKNVNILKTHHYMIIKNMIYEFIY